MQKRIYSSSLEAVLYTTRAVISDGGVFGSILSGSRCLLQTPSVLHDASKIKKCHDSLYNKADILTMNIGREVVIGKVPNPNTGIRHHQLVYWYYALQILPPQVYAWNSRVDGNNLVSAESIVMIKCKVYPSPKSRSVSAARLDQNMFAIFSNSEIKGDCSQILSFRNLHYCKDIELAMPRTQLHVDEAEQLVDSSQFARGPAVSRE